MGRRSESLAPRPVEPLTRAPLDPGEVARIRQERLAPRFRQWDYLHLRGLRDALANELTALPDGPALDLFCGAKPYAPLMRAQPVWGLDIDRHFGAADVIGGRPLPLPFRNGAFGAVVATQALHLVDDPAGTVAEIGRVLRPGGQVVVTVPHLFLAEGPFERHWSGGDLAALFSDWEDVRIHGIDGPGTALAFVLGRVAMLGARRWRAARALLPPAVAVLNTVGLAVDRLLPWLGRRWPHSLLLVARRPL